MTITRSVQPNTIKNAEVGLRQVLAVVSSERRDRVGDIVKQDGIDFSDFMRGGGTILWQHDSNHPVARTVQMGLVNGNLTALAQFPPEGTSAKSDECYRLIREGVVNSTSIGFVPEEWDFIDKNRSGSGILFRKVELLEFSFVSVPANPSALIIGKALHQRRMPYAPAPEREPLPIQYSGTYEQRQWQADYANVALRRRRALVLRFKAGLPC